MSDYTISKSLQSRVSIGEDQVLQIRLYRNFLDINVSSIFTDGESETPMSTLTPVLDSTAIGRIIGEFGISGTSGPFTATLTSNPGSLFSIVNGNRLAVAGILSVGDATFEAQVTNGAVTIPPQEFTLPVVSVFDIPPPIPLEDVYVGNVVLSLATAADWLTYTIISNPGDLFLLNGNNVILGSIPPLGLTTIALEDSDGKTLNYSFDVQSIAPLWTLGTRPFAADSPGNQPLPDDSILVPCNWPGPFTQSFYFAVRQFNIDIPTASAPFVTVTATSSGWGNSSGPFSRQMTAGFSGSTANTDKESISIIGNDGLSLWVHTRLTDTTGTTNQWAQSNMLTGSGFGTISPFKGAGVLGSGQNPMMGALVKDEFLAGEIEHVIALALYFANASPGFFSPAINSDASASTGFVCYGQRMAIPKATAQPAGLSPYGPKLFRALQNYGALISDTGINQFYAPSLYNGGTNSVWTGYSPGQEMAGLRDDAIILIPMLQKVGYVLDGIQVNIGAYASCVPQIQRLAYTGNCLHVTRDSDATGLDVGFGAAPQSLLNTAAIATFGSGTTVRVTTYFGQISSRNFVSAGSNAPIIYQSGALKTISGQPALAFDGSTNWLDAAGTSAGFANGSMYLVAVLQVPDRAANYVFIGPDTAGGLKFQVDITTGFVRMLADGGATIGITPYAVPLNATVIVSGFYKSDGSYSIWFNFICMVQGTGTLVGVTPANIRIGAGPSGTSAFKGLISAWHVSSNISSNISQQQFVLENYLKAKYATLGTIAVNATTLNPANKSAGVNLSGGNLTATNAVTGSSSAFSTLSKTSGKFYCEILCVASNDSSDVIGIANGSMPAVVGNYPGIDLNGVGYWSSGVVKINAVTVATIATWTTNSQVVMAVDVTAQKVWFGVIITGNSVLWNNDILANQNPATGTGGIDISSLNAGPYFAVLAPHAFASKLTANFGGSAYFNNTLVPSGFGYL